MTDLHGFRPFERSALDTSIPARFAEQVARHGARLAVRAADASIDYDELDRRARGVARALLARLGTGPEPVALLLDQGAALIAAILGILAAGKFYVPLDPGERDARLREILDDIEPRALLTSSVLGAAARTWLPQQIAVLDVETSARAGSGAAPALPPVSPDALAYVFYTSGSTGRPKGVMDTHRNVLHNVMRYTNSLGLGAGDRLSLLQRASFSGSVSSLFGALLNGGAVYPFDLAGEGAARLADLLERERLTVYHSVPSIFRRIAREAQRFGALRWVRLEGDRMTPRDVELFERHFPPGCRLVNGLGATECGLVRQHFLEAARPVTSSVIPVGGPVPDMEVLVLGEGGDRLGPGVTGELAVRSRYLSPGYWRQPEATARAFRLDEGDPSLRVYRTGDLGRLLEDGTLLHLGRADARVKLRGSFVELPDVEAAVLAAAPELRACAAVARERADGELELVACVAGAPRDPQALRRALRGSLPAVAVPARIVSLDALPLTPHGKLDRARLAELAAPATAAVATTPEGPLEARLLAIFQKLLEHREIGIEDDFFDLGGDSLLAVALLLEVERAFGRRLAPATLLDAPSVQALASRILSAKPADRSFLVSFRREGSAPPLFLVPGALGSALQFRELARLLGPDQPVHAFEPAGLAGEEEPDTSVEAMAERYLGELAAVHPQGPVRLAGTCLGSLVAFEMARRLAASGRAVEPLVMLGDALLPAWVADAAPAPGGGAALTDALRRVLFHLRHAPLSDVVRSAWSEAALRLRPSRRHHRAVLQAHHWARARYRVGPYPGAIVYLRLGSRGANPGEKTWERVAAGGLLRRDVRVVSDRWHRPPHVREVARTLTEAFRAAPP